MLDDYVRFFIKYLSSVKILPAFEPSLRSIKR